MARPTVLNDGKRINISIDGKLHVEATKKAKRLGHNFSEYVARLLVADMARKGSAASGASRHLPRKGVQ